MLQLLRPVGVRTLTQRAMLSTRNSIVLSNLPVSVTDELLRSSTKELEVKDIRLQRGCSLHFSDKTQADLWVKYLTNKKVYKVFSIYL